MTSQAFNAKRAYGTRETSYHRTYEFLILLLALGYGAVLAGLPLDVFKDRDDYMIFAHHSWGILIHFWSSSPLAALSNEPLWLMMNAGLKQYFRLKASCAR